jgi:NTP pyrophosphatase (non-canonical NTP hydrolase)
MPLLPALVVEPMAALDVDDLQRQLRAFAEAREWERFHSPKNLAMAVASEAGELVDVFQWLSEEESRHLLEEDRRRATEEIADVLIYLLRLGDKLGVDLQEAIVDKMKVNEQKYPVDLAKGNAVKYNRREKSS